MLLFTDHFFFSPVYAIVWGAFHATLLSRILPSESKKCAQRNKWFRVSNCSYDSLSASSPISDNLLDSRRQVILKDKSFACQRLYWDLLFDIGIRLVSWTVFPIKLLRVWQPVKALNNTNHKSPVKAIVYRVLLFSLTPPIKNFFHRFDQRQPY